MKITDLPSMVCDVYIASGVHQYSSVKNETFLIIKLIQNIYKEGKDFVYLVCTFMKCETLQNLYVHCLYTKSFNHVCYY